MRLFLGSDHDNMTAYEYQRALCDVISSPQLCIRIRAQGSGLEDYELSVLERRRIVAAVGHHGMAVTCTLYRINRMTPLVTLLPMTCQLLGGRLVEEAVKFWASHPVTVQFQMETEAFAAFLRAQVLARRLDAPYLEDVLRYELALNRAQFREAHLHAQPATEEIEDVEWLELEYDPQFLLTSLAAGTLPPPGLPKGSYRMLIRT